MVPPKPILAYCNFVTSQYHETIQSDCQTKFSNSHDIFEICIRRNWFRQILKSYYYFHINLAVP